MTRFARASGSKGSNERQPEEATSWQEMRKQMEQKKYQVEANKAGLLAFEQRNKIAQTSLSKENIWAEFELPKKENGKSKMKNKKKNKPLSNQNDKLKGNDSQKEEKPTDKVESKLTPKNGKKSTKKIVKVKVKLTKSKQQQNVIDNEGLERINKKKKLNKLINEKKDSQKKEEPTDKVESKLTLSKEKKSTKKVIKVKKKLSKSNQQQNIIENEGLERINKKKKLNKPVNENKDNNQINTQVPNKTNNIKPNYFLENSGQSSDTHMNTKRPKGHNKLGGKRKAELSGETMPWKRRKAEPLETIMFINGEKVPVVKFDGFPIQKKDAEALIELRNKLKEQGINEDEIKQTMKIANRRAQKSLTRLRKSVCFNCRKSGHLLSDCPEIGMAQDRPVIGVCYKCGSTEHSYLDCKVSKSTGFRFAECFICREQGHIARECPDNPRGLYPKGGACKLCGDVTHFKKDCPTTMEIKQNNKIELPLLDNRNVEAIEQNSQVLTNESKELPTKKIVKF